MLNNSLKKINSNQPKKSHLSNLGSLFKIAFTRWWAKDPFRESAIIAYYAIFSLPGLLVVIMTIAGYFLGSDKAGQQLAYQISSNLGTDTAKQVQDMIISGSELKNSFWAAVLGIATIIIGATAVFVQFQKSLNTIWEVKADKKKSGILSLVRVRIFSFGLIIAIAFIMLVSFVLTTLIVAMGDWLTSYFSESFITLIRIINFIVSRLVFVMLFAMMFKYIPDAKIKWRHVWLGSIVTTILSLLGMSGLSLYFGKADPGGGYGAAGSVILILLWVSYSSMIVFFGAEFTRAYADLHDGKIAPDENATEKKNIENK